jgi:hypothetical protein
MTSCLLMSAESLPAGLSFATGWMSRRLPVIENTG